MKTDKFHISIAYCAIFFLPGSESDNETTMGAPFCNEVSCDTKGISDRIVSQERGAMATWVVGTSRAMGSAQVKSMLVENSDGLYVDIKVTSFLSINNVK